jgi:hypothetical protein
MATTIFACGLVAFFFLLWLWSKIASWLQRHKTRTKALDELEAAIKNLDKVLTQEREAKQRFDEQALRNLDRRLAEKREALSRSDEQAAMQRKIELSKLDKQLTEKRELETRMSEEYIYNLDKTLAKKREAEMRSNEQTLRKREVTILNLDKSLSKEREASSCLIEQNLNQREAELRELERVLNEKSKSFPWLAGAIADLVLLKNNEVSDYLRTKRNPAYSAARTISEMGKEKRILAEQLKLTQYTIAQYESLFPFLTDFRENEIEDALLEINETYQEQPEQQEDPARIYLAPGEYAMLSPTERNQRALDRYRQARKSSFQLGRDYERYVGYLYERQGYQVSYYGIENGKEDLGRDLICKKNGRTEVVQCKYWSKHKLIHEKHINQLFGTTVMMYLQSVKMQPTHQQLHLFPQLLADGNITAVFYTSTNLSETARHFAEALSIQVHEQIALGEYPIIKCHISTITGEKIYHLPFDQMYDRTKLDKTGEFYAMTVVEAEAKGFRRAWKWRG